MKNRLHIIMPMAGEGNRFKKKGYSTPKPLIKLFDKELYKWSLDSLKSLNKLDIEIVHTFIIRKEFVSIKEELLNSYPNANVVTVEKTTRGALETCLLASKYIYVNDYVLILDCDLHFNCKKYLSLLQYIILNNDSTPMLLGFYSHDPKYSYAEYDAENGYRMNTIPLKRTTEKDPISNCALVGCYFIGKGQIFKERGNKVIQDFESGKIKDKEIYVSLIYNYLLDLEPRICQMNLYFDKLYSLGTPEDLERFSFDRNIWD